MLTLAVLPALTQGLFFDMTPEAERCFTEIVGEDTKMVVEYENPDFVPFGRPGFTGVVSPAAEVCCCFGPVRPHAPPPPMLCLARPVSPGPHPASLG